MLFIWPCVHPGCFYDIYGIDRRTVTNLVTSASWDKDELIRFWSQKVKGQGISVTKGPGVEAYIAWRWVSSSNGLVLILTGIYHLTLTLPVRGPINNIII